MGRSSKSRSGQKARNRTSVLLLSLADLADRAAGASWPVRCLVLWALYHADAFTRRYLLTFPQAADLESALVTLGDGFDAVDAMRLALSLRVLALAVQIIAQQDRDVSASGEALDVVGRERRIPSRAPSTLLCATGPAHRLNTS